MIDTKGNSYTCPRCTVGRCHPQATTYVDIHQGQLLSVPNMPLYVCDVCHFAEFDLDALESLLDTLDLDVLSDDLRFVSGKDRPAPLSD